MPKKDRNTLMETVKPVEVTGIPTPPPQAMDWLNEFLRCNIEKYGAELSREIRRLDEYGEWEELTDDGRPPIDADPDGQRLTLHIHQKKGKLLEKLKVGGKYFEDNSRREVYLENYSLVGDGMEQWTIYVWKWDEVRPLVHLKIYVLKQQGD